MLKNVKTFFRINEDEPELNRARYRALARQLPLMYGIVTINMIAVALTHLGTAPIFLTIVSPLLLSVFTVVRTVRYVRSRTMPISDEMIASRLRTTLWLVGPFSFLFAAWGLSFYPYGTPDHHTQVVFFIGVTTTACAYCLMHLRQAAIMLLVTVTVTTTAFLLAFNNHILAAIAFNLALVAVVFGFLLMRSERDFTRLILQRGAQMRHRQKLQMLYEENKRIAESDSLTNLANRRQFLARMDESVAERSADFAIALLDLTGFKTVNDVYGHPAGDQVLSEVGERLQETLRDENVVLARLGGDEFGILFHAPGNDDAVLGMANRIKIALQDPFHFQEGSANLDTAIGLARFPSTADTRCLLFDRAEYALCYAKQTASQEPVFFSHEHERLILERSAIEQALREANLEKEMSVEFQPVLDLQHGHTRGLEALARWHSPTLGPVRPDLFIEIAEQIGIIGRLTEVLFRKALADACEWPENLLLSFNLSVISLTSKGPVMRLLSIAEQVGFPLNRLMFEITETSVMKDFESAMEVLEHVQSHGVHVAIDDFGTGFSSLAYVHRLPIDTLKIDRSFIQDILSDQRSVNVLRSILSLCNNLDIACVIEGIETQEQFDLVFELGARFIQGHYYSKALSSGDTHMVLQIEFSEENIASLRQHRLAS